MIIVEIKSKKQLREAPLSALINVGNHKRAATIGKAGMASDPEGFVRISKDLYKNTKQDLVIILPSARLLADIVTDAGVRSGQSIFESPQVLKDFLKEKGIDSDKVHVLIPASTQIEKDNTKPLWTMVHDAIGHHLENVRDLDPTNYIPDYTQGEDLLKVGEALYAGISKSHQAAGENLEQIKREQIAKLKLYDLFDVVGPLKDDRWPDILAAIALEEYDENKVSSYLEEQGREDLKDALMEKVQSLIGKVKIYSKWEPGFTTILKSW